MLYKSLRIIKRLVNAGHETVIVGGFVRDLIWACVQKGELKKNFFLKDLTQFKMAQADIDIATSASPEEIIFLFKKEKKIDLVGKNFGVVIVNGIEVASYRGEAYHVPGKPRVYRVGTFLQDAARRDFTINAMALKFTHDQFELIDYFGGVQDLLKGIIKSIGNPQSRFSEDPARLFRAATLAARMGLKIEDGTAKAIQGLANLYVHPVRFGKELKKVLETGDAACWLALLKKLNLLSQAHALPELAPLVGLKQDSHPNQDVWEHTLAVVRATQKAGADLIVMLAAIFHDCGKGSLKEYSSIYPDQGHEITGISLTRKALLRMDFGKEIANNVVFLIRYHMVRPTLKVENIMWELQKMARDFRNREEMRAGLQRLFLLMKANISTFSPRFKIILGRELVVFEKVSFELLNKVPFFTKDLPVTGYDLIQKGYKGVEIREQQAKLLREAQARMLKNFVLDSQVKKT